MVTVALDAVCARVSLATEHTFASVRKTDANCSFGENRESRFWYGQNVFVEPNADDLSAYGSRHSRKHEGNTQSGTRSRNFCSEAVLTSMVGLGTPSA